MGGGLVIPCGGGGDVGIGFIGEEGGGRGERIPRRVYVLDRSRSFHSYLLDAGRWLRRSLRKFSTRGEVGLVSFAREAGVEVPLVIRDRFRPRLENVLDTRFTDMERGLSLALGLLPFGGQVVLLTDGWENRGKLSRVRIPEGVEVYVKFFWPPFILERVEFPSVVSLGEEVGLQVFLRARDRRRVSLVLRGGGVRRRKVVWLDGGVRRVMFFFRPKRSGFQRYTLELDGVSYRFGLWVRSEWEVLVVSPQADILRGRWRRWDWVLPSEFPEDLVSLLKYRCIFFWGVKYSSLDVGRWLSLRSFLRAGGGV
ncbi:MAG: VWA domain-containing protein, partial [Planctomycetota bacterium]